MLFVYGSIFSVVNSNVSTAAHQLSTSPANFSPSIFNLIKNLSENVILPIAGMVLTYIAVIELIQMIIDHNNLANFETWFIWRWIIKTFIAVELLANVFTIVMAVFDVSDHVIRNAGGLIGRSTAITANLAARFESTLRSMNIGQLIVVLFMSIGLWIGILIMAIIIWVIVYARMVEIYMMVSLSPIPFATISSREHSHVGWNYFRSIAALGFQGFLMMVCIGIYAVLIQSITFSSDIIATVWGIFGYTVLLCFSLLRTSELAKTIFSAR